MKRIQLYLHQFVQTIPMHWEAFLFIQKYKPWQSMDRYGWAARVLIGLAVLMGLFFFGDVLSLLKNATEHPEVVGAGINSFFHDFSWEKLDWTLMGSKKYLILIVLEVFTFHFIQKTLEIQMGRKPENTFSAFVAAEKRMIKASFAAYISEIVTIAIFSVIIGLFGLSDILKEPVKYVIQFYFLGFTIIDNYHECFGLTLKESRKKTKKVIGVALAVGAVAFILMYIPFIGVVAATMIGAVTATMAMQKFAPMEIKEQEEFV